MAGYDPNKAATFNKLRQQGLTEDQAAEQAGIGADDFGNYSIGTNGQMGPIIAGSGTQTVAPTAAQQAESDRFTAGLSSSPSFEQVDFSQTPASPPGTVRPVTYTTTSTETVSGGGSTTVVAGARQATPASQAVGTAFDAKQTEYNAFIQNNPSDFVRKRQGLPPMTAEEKANYEANLNRLNSEKEALKTAQINAETPGQPTIINTPNTTTTQTTVTTGVSTASAATFNEQNDQRTFDQTQLQIGSSIPSPLSTSPPLLTDRELLQIYPETDPQEVGALRGTTIITDEARRIMSDPAMIQQQLALNAAAVSPTPPITTARQLSDQETSRLFETIDNPPAAANNRTTGAEYQAAADEITAIINAQRAERAPIEAQQELLQNRQELLIARQQSALNTLQAAEADPTNTAFLEASRTAYARATGEVNATNLAIQQNRSILAQSRQATAELQDQRNNLEVKADFADRSPPGLNSLTPPATVLPDQEATYVAPPAAPVLPVVAAESQIESPAEPIAASAQNNQLTRVEYQAAADEVFEIQRAARDTSAELAGQVAQNQAAYLAAESQATQLRREYRAAEEAGASSTELASLAADYEAQIEVTNQLGQQLNQSQSALAANQAYRQTLADQENYLTLQASQAASGPPGLNSVPGPGTVEPGQSVTAVNSDINGLDLPTSFSATNVNEPVDSGINGLDLPTSFSATNVNDPYYGLTPEQLQLLGGADPTDPYIRARLGIPQLPGSELQATPGFGTIKTGVPLIDNALNFIGSLFGGPPKPAAAPVAASGDEALQAVQDAEAAQLAAQEGRAFPPVQAPLDPAASGDEALQAFEDAEAAALGAQEGGAFAEPAPVPASGDEALQAIQDAEDAALAAQEGRAFPPVEDPAAVPPSGDEALQAIENAEAAALAAQEGRAFAEPAPVAASGDEALQAIEDAEAEALAQQEGLAFPPVENPAAVPAAGDEALQAIQDAEAAALAREEGIAFLEPLPVDAAGDEALQAAQDAELAAQEGLAFPPIQDPAPVAGDEALQAFEDAQAAELARAEGVAFAEPLDVPASGDEALQAIEDAELAAQEGSAFATNPEPVPASGDEALQAFEDAQAAELAAQEGSAFPPVEGPAPVAGDEALQAFEDAQAAELAAQEGSAFGAQPSENSATRVQTNDAQRQNTLNDRVNMPANADWRVRLSLANSATYLYRASQPGILAPLAKTNGVVFPYTPSIETSYQAKYDGVDLVHSNYRGYFYKNSSVDQVNIRGTFTAQDTREAEYLLAVITFFKSVTKMFYGATDPLAGTPPPLVFLSGLGQYQFNNNPCVISNFQYSLPSDVDYIRANGFNNYGVNLDNRRQQSSGPPATGILGAIASVNRLTNNALVPGALPQNAVAPNPVSANNSKTNYTNSTYVPTKMEISLTLLPIQTRSQMSQQFELQKFASGSLLQQGYW